MWTPHETQSLQADVDAGRIGRDWRFRFEGDAQDFTVNELLEKEAAARTRPAAANAFPSIPHQTYPAVRTLAPSTAHGIARACAILIWLSSLLTLLAVLVPAYSFSHQQQRRPGIDAVIVLGFGVLALYAPGLLAAWGLWRGRKWVGGWRSLSYALVYSSTFQ